MVIVFVFVYINPEVVPIHHNKGTVRVRIRHIHSCGIQYLLSHPEESSENTCGFGKIRKYVWAFTMGVYEK